MSDVVPPVALDPDKIAEQVGRRIAELRRQRGWSQQILADKVRGTFQWISQVESGQNLTIHTLAKVANAFQVTLAELLVPPDPDDPLVNRAGRGRPKKPVG